MNHGNELPVIDLKETRKLSFEGWGAKVRVVIVKNKITITPHVDDVVSFLVSTSEFNWGRGKTLLEALRNAKALSTKGDKLKRGVRVNVSKFTQRDGDQWTEEKEQAALRSGLTIKGYEYGDFVEPFVDGHGGHRGYGELESITVDKNTELEGK